MKTIFPAGLAMAVLLLTSAAANAQTTQPTLEQARAAARQKYAAELPNSKPLEKAYSIQEFCAISVEGESLRITSSAMNEMTGTRLAVRVREFDDPFSVTIVQLPGDIPRVASFSLMDFHDPSAVFVRVVGFWATGHVELSVRRQLLDGTSETVTLSQRNDLDGDVVNLVVLGKGNTPLASFQAASFTRLYERNRASAGPYLRRIFRALKQETVAGVNEAAAWQVLLDYWPVDPAVVAKVNDLLAKLDSEDYPTRELAGQELASMGRPGALALAATSSARLTAQQRVTVENLLSRHMPLKSDQAAQLRVNPAFLASCLGSADVSVVEAAHRELERLLRRSVPFDIKADQSTRMDAADRLIGDLESAATQPAPR